MYLKTLELQGFKSFPDKTVIDFDKGMTAIVGANGSGKSNISDAVRWVLGEMSAKSLRGNKMEDVIFNGSSKRKPAAFAEVVMTIDNSDDLMKIDYDEVSVGRRLYRSGESEYYLNKKQVRLKDVVDLFLNTGIGREGYSVISQGKIAEIISLKGNERRELFEEAAGISRFRYRKHEAGLKLQTVTENSLRINDILTEVQGRLPRLEVQSAKAKEYLSVLEEKKQLELGIWFRRMQQIRSFLSQGAIQYKNEDRELTQLSQAIEEQDRVMDALYIETQEKNLRAEVLRGELTELASSDSELSASLSVLENEVHHMDLKKAELLALEESDDGKEKELLAEKEKIFFRFSDVQRELDSIEENFSKNRAEQGAIAQSYADLTEREEALWDEKEELVRKKSALSLQLKEDEGFNAAGYERRKELEKRLSEGDGRDEALRRRLQEVRQNAEVWEKKRKDEEAENGAIQLELYRIGEELEEKNQAFQEKRLKKMEAEQRRDTLLRMERLLEGFSDSVKEIMNASEKELSGICGPISKLISTPEQYVLAIETALGGGIQNVVVESEENAKQAISFLKKNRLGRATFLPLDTLRTGRYDVSRIRENGFLGIASDLCQCEERYIPAVEFLLGKTLVCSDVEAASRLAKKEKYGVRIVTLDGQIIHAGGSYTGGQALNLTGVLSRSADLAKLKESISSLDREIAHLRSETENSEEKRSALRARSQESEKRLTELRKKAGEAKNTLSLEEERMTEAKNAILVIRREMDEIQEKIRQRQELALSIGQEIDRVEQREHEILGALGTLRKEKEEKEKLREDLIVLQGEILAGRGQAQIRLEQEAIRLSENEEALRLLKEGSETKEKRLIQLEEEKKNALGQIQTINSRKEELLSSMNAKKREIADLTERVEKAGEESALIRQKQKVNQTEKEQRMEAFSRLASRLSAAEKEKEGICRSLAEEYELSTDSEEFLAAEKVDSQSLGGQERLQTLRARLRKIGPVNLDSVQELEEAKERFEFLNGQYADITKSKEELEKLIADLENTMRDMFCETFEKIRYTFRQIFVELFGGGSADIELTNQEDLLNCGVEIKVQPPGKVIKNLSLLSGGEQAFVAIALYMSLLRINPSPFCIFDEIESALDEANVRRFAEYIKKHNDKTQFIVITHRRGTMEEADTLYGITMQEKGVSDFIRLDASESEKFASDGK